MSIARRAAIQPGLFPDHSGRQEPYLLILAFLRRSPVLATGFEWKEHFVVWIKRQIELLAQVLSRARAHWHSAG